MILNVSHTTTYHYDQPVRGVVQSHRLTPALFDGQRVIEWKVAASDGVSGGAFRDGAGDWVVSHSAAGPLSELTVSVTGTVETTDLSGILRGHRERVPPEAYLRETAPTRPDIALFELGQAAVSGGADPLDRAHRLAAAVAQAIVYRPGVTHAHTTAAEALAQGEGVCQDHTHALLAAARAQEIPARYVSGYLHASEGGAEEDAAHAWAELWVAGLGAWVGFDAANACCPDERYIRLGSGHDSRSAAPIRGIARGAGAESLEVTVAVDAVQQ
jgi:transglutaminase-like putative cysteine protease